jgi:hypothetical protein
LYCDKDNVIFIQNIHEHQKVRTDLGHLTDEMQEFGSRSFFKNLCLVEQRTMRFLFQFLDKKTYNQLQGEMYNLVLLKLEGSKVHHIERYDSERHSLCALT